MDAREAEQVDAGQNARGKSNPSRATRSNVGVSMTASPYTPACGQDQSSAIASRMLGRGSGVGGAPAAPRAVRAAQVTRTMVQPSQTDNCDARVEVGM